MRGIVHCCDLRFFIAKPGPEQIERQSQLVQERLRAIIKTFGKKLPVFTIFTKGDQIPYFRDFFGRFPEQEADQILGCTLKLSESGGDVDQAAFASVEAKRLSKAFHNLYTSLTERRISVLFHESVAGRKSRIFEFPREFNRIRQSIIDFLVQTFRPSPLEPTPVNRGIYFAGTREVEPLPAAALDTSAKGFETINVPFQQPLDATILFRGDPADLIKASGADADLNLTRIRRGGLQTRFAFLAALFKDVICRDRSVGIFSVPAIVESRFRSPRTVALGLLLSASVILALLWSISWLRNFSLIRSVDRASLQSAGPVVQEVLPNLRELESLEALRQRVEDLGEYEKRWNLTMRFGLYTAGQLREAVREAYFRRLRASVLDPTNEKLTSFLQSLGQPTDPGAPSNGTVTDRLKTHIMTTSPGTCTVEPSVVATELTAMMGQAGLRASDTRFPLASRQIEFYAKELQSSTPVKLTAHPEAQKHALDYVSRSRNVDQYYKALIDSLERELGGYVETYESCSGL